METMTTEADLALRPARRAEAAEIAALRTRAAEALTRVHGEGRWSGACTERRVLVGMARGQVLAGRWAGRIAATLTLADGMPAGLDADLFTPARRTLYLLGMAVEPELQRRGLGRRTLREAERLAREAGAEAIRLDAFDAAAGAGPFYTACGYAERGRAVYMGAPLIFFERVL